MSKHFNPDPDEAPLWKSYQQPKPVKTDCQRLLDKAGYNSKAAVRRALRRISDSRRYRKV